MDRMRPGRSISPIRQAEAYWNALTEEYGDLPMRSQIDPRALENILGNTFVLERIAPGLARFRVAGRSLNQLAGMEVRGMPVTAFFEPQARSEISAVLEHVFHAPAMAELSLTTGTARAGAPEEARMILLPLRDGSGAVSRALGVIVSGDAGPKAGLLKFRISATSLKPAGYGVREQRPTRHPEEQPEGFAEDQAILKSPASHLRVVK